jgi:hypothetical protein
MRRLTLILMLLAPVLMAPPAYADDGNGYALPRVPASERVASHSAAGGAECGTFRSDSVAEMTKGRTDGLVISVDHQDGCARVVIKNLSPAGHGEAQGNAGQVARCERYGREEAAGVFRYYFDRDVAPADIAVSCLPYRGDD